MAPAGATKAALPGLAGVVKQLAGNISPASDSLPATLPPQAPTVTSVLQTPHGRVQVTTDAATPNAPDLVAASAANSTNLAEAITAIDRQELPAVEVPGPEEGTATTERTPARNPRVGGFIRGETAAIGDQTAQTSDQQLPVQALSPALPNDGMNPAKQGLQMSAKQLLPPDEIEAGLEIPVGRGVPTGRRGIERSQDVTGHHTGQNPFMLNPAPVNQGDLVVTATSNASAVERVERLVAQSIQSFRLEEPQQLSVVLRPAAGLEVSLHLRRTPDGVEAQLRCDTNQAAVLLGGWDTLKKDLANQGVRLLPLETAPGQSQPSTFSNSTGFSQQQSSGPPRWSGRSDAFSPSNTPLASLSSRRTPAAAVTQPNALLDRWA
jgi:hypothetical protein